MIYLSDIKQSSYVYRLMCTKCLLNLCIHMYTCRYTIFSRYLGLYRVYSKKTGKLESVRKIIESKQLSGGNSTDPSTAHVMDVNENQVVSRDLGPTLTKNKSSNLLDKDSTYVDSREKGEIQE